MSYTNAQVATILKGIEGRLAALDARVAALTPVAASTPAQAPAASAPIVIPDRQAAKVARVMCAKHPEHVKGYTPNGLAAHRTWCPG